MGHRPVQRLQLRHRQDFGRVPGDDAAAPTRIWNEEREVNRGCDKQYALAHDTAVLVAKEITERVAKRLEDLSSSKCKFNLKATIYNQVIDVLENGVEV